MPSLASRASQSWKGRSLPPRWFNTADGRAGIGAALARQSVVLQGAAETFDNMRQL
jgi:hypothetical protein